VIWPAAAHPKLHRFRQLVGSRPNPHHRPRRLRDQGELARCKPAMLHTLSCQAALTRKANQYSLRFGKWSRFGHNLSQILGL
jgi:hypothetical protein